MFPHYPHRVIAEEASVLEVLSQLAADDILALVYRVMQLLNRCGARWQSVAYQLLPVKLRGTLLRQPVPVAALCSDALELQRAALAHVDYRRQQRSVADHPVFQHRYCSRRQFARLPGYRLQRTRILDLLPGPVLEPQQ